ncbi:MAG TPA: DUF3108 domain-containing protein [Telluria sp.]
MSIASAMMRRRRQLALGVVTVLLHLIVFDWFRGQIGLVHDEHVRTEPPMLAQLITEAPAPVPAPVPPPEPTLSLPPLPKLDPLPVALVALPAPAPTPAPSLSPPADEQAPAGDAGAQAAVQARAAPGPGNVQSGQATAVNTAAPAQPPAQPKPAAPAQPEGRHYKVDLPPSSDITLDVARVDANGTHWSGEELLSWRLSPSGYRIRVEAGISVVFTRVNLLTVTSEGTVGDEGFVPTLMTEKRRGRSMTATHFNRGAGTLTFSASQASYPLVPGAQDKASVPLQLAAIARGDAKQLSGNIDIFVGEDRDASVFSFVVVGQEQIDTPLGRIKAWHLVRPPKPGSYSSRLDLWLAPNYGWVPVRIRNLEASGAVTTETARRIVKKDAGSS